MSVSQTASFTQIRDSLDQGQSVAEMIGDIRAAYNLGHVTYHLIRNPSEGADSPYVRTTYPMEWLGIYVARQYVNIDPVVRAGISRAAPFDWASLSGEPHYDEVMDAAGEFGVGRNGFTIPIVDKRGRRSLLSLNSRKADAGWQNLVSRHAGDWNELGHLVHRKGVYEAYGKQDPLRMLGPRELECITWTARGREMKEIAILLRLSEHTVRVYLRSVKHKLACRTLSQAVAQALKYHLISP